MKSKLSIQSKIQYLKAAKFARLTKRAIIKTMKGVGQEAKETKVMSDSFFRLLKNKLDLDKRNTAPSEEEIKIAIEQLIDVGRFTVFTGISILPGGGISLIGLELLAKKLGVKNFTFIPSAFRKEDNNKLSIEKDII